MQYYSANTPTVSSRGARKVAQYAIAGETFAVRADEWASMVRSQGARASGTTVRTTHTSRQSLLRFGEKWNLDAQATFLSLSLAESLCATVACAIDGAAGPQLTSLELFLCSLLAKKVSGSNSQVVQGQFEYVWFDDMLTKGARLGRMSAKAFAALERDTLHRLDWRLHRATTVGFVEYLAVREHCSGNLEQYSCTWGELCAATIKRARFWAFASGDVADGALLAALSLADVRRIIGLAAWPGRLAHITGFTSINLVTHLAALHVKHDSVRL